MSDKKIPTLLVIGAGPGGLAFAHGIQNLCNKNEKKFNVKVFERDECPSVRWQGKYLAIRPQGLQSLFDCVSDNVKTTLHKAMPDPILASESNKYIISDEVGNPLIRLSGRQIKDCYELGNLSKHDYQSGMVIFRDNLRNILIEALENTGNKINWGKKCVGYEEVENGVYAIFDDGSREFGDILVAADGVNSPIRKQKYPELKVKSTGLHQVLTHVTVPESLFDRAIKCVNKTIMSNSLCPNGESNLVMYRAITNKEETGYPMLISYDYHEAHDTSAKRIYREDRGGIVVDDDAKETAEDIVNDVKNMILKSRPPCELTDTLLELWSLAPISDDDKNAVYLPRRRAIRDIDPYDVKNWKTSRVTFVGDSTHACTYYFAIGFNMTLQDAGDLSKSFMNWDEDGWKACVENYEMKMRERGSRFVRRSRRDALFHHKIYKTNLGWWLKKSFYRVLSTFLKCKSLLYPYL